MIASEILEYPALSTAPARLNEPEFTIAMMLIVAYTWFSLAYMEHIHDEEGIKYANDDS